MGHVIQGPWKSGGQDAPVQSVPSSEPSNTDRLIINEVNRLCAETNALCNALLALDQRTRALEQAGGHDVRP